MDHTGRIPKDLPAALPGAGMHITPPPMDILRPLG